MKKKSQCRMTKHGVGQLWCISVICHSDLGFHSPFVIRHWPCAHELTPRCTRASFSQKAVLRHFVAHFDEENGNFVDFAQFSARVSDKVFDKALNRRFWERLANPNSRVRWRRWLRHLA